MLNCILLLDSATQFGLIKGAGKLHCDAKKLTLLGVPYSRLY